MGTYTEEIAVRHSTSAVGETHTYGDNGGKPSISLKSETLSTTPKAAASSSRFTTKKYQWIGRALRLHHSPTHLHLHVNLDSATSANNDCQSVHATIADEKESKATRSS
ncbi:hypothetical protein JHK82_034229 [Glycine max]|nr:hypothetical protein JHK82_034229 [Glycine max]